MRNVTFCIGFVIAGLFVLLRAANENVPFLSGALRWGALRWGAL